MNRRCSRLRTTVSLGLDAHTLICRFSRDMFPRDRIIEFDSISHQSRETNCIVASATLLT